MSSYVKYKNLLENYIKPRFEKKHIAEIDRDFLEIFCLELTERGGKKGLGLSSKTITDILSVIRSIMQYAGRKKLSPVCDVTGITVIKKGNKRPVTLSQQEQNVLCKYLQENPTSINLGILFSLFTGLRIGEICALKWSDISFAENTVYVHQTMQRIQIDGQSEKKTEIIITSPKSSCSIRRIPLPNDLMKLINQHTPRVAGVPIHCRSASSGTSPAVLAYWSFSITEPDFEDSQPGSATFWPVKSIRLTSSVHSRRAIGRTPFSRNE